MPVSRIITHPKKTDWFVVPHDWYPDLADVPGIVAKPAGFEVHRSHLPLLCAHEGVRAELAAFKIQYDPVALSDVTLRPYQQVAVDFIRVRRGVLLGDQMRLGKTPTSLATHDPASGPLIVIAPLSVRDVWLTWMRRLWPDIEPSVIKGRTYDREALIGPPIVFGHYDILKHHNSMGLRAGTLIFDEVHLLSNPRSARTMTALAWAAYAEQVIGLSGTPLWNRPKGIWPLMAAINPGAWGTVKEFQQRYADPAMTGHGYTYRGASNVAEFRARLDEVMIARTWQDVAPELPPVERCIEVVDLTDAMSEKIDAAVDDIRKGIRSIEIAQQMAFRSAVSRAKEVTTIDVACRTLDAGEPCVVWAWHRKAARAIGDGITKSGRGAYVVTGLDPIDVRERTLTAWRDDPAGALVVTMVVGQVGIDLSHARHAIFGELDYTPAVIAQSEMRTFHISRPMTVTYVVLDHPMDRRLIEILTEKVMLANQVGMRAAEAAIDVITTAFGVAPEDAGDLDRLAEIFLRGGDELDEIRL